MINTNKDEFLWRDKPITDRIMGWFKDHEGKNIFGQPVDPFTTQDISELVAGVANPFRAVGSANTFKAVVGHIRGWKGYKLDISKKKAKGVLKRVSMDTGISTSDLIKFAKKWKKGKKFDKSNKIIERFDFDNIIREEFYGLTYKPGIGITRKFDPPKK